MALPSVQISVSDGALGRTVATDDGVAGLIVTGTAPTGLALNVAKRIYSLSEALTLGISATTHPHAYGQISDFYTQAGTGAELWIMFVAEATTHAAVFVGTTGPAQKLLEAAQGRITILATSMGRAVGYTPTVVGLNDFDVPAVSAAAQAIAATFMAQFTPVDIILDGSYLPTTLGAITTLKSGDGSVSLFTGVSESGKRSASIGRYLGRLAAIPVQQSIARVKTGMFSANGALTSGLPLSSYSNAQLASLHDAGYQVLRNFPGVLGAFVSDDVTLALPTSDFTSLARRRVMNKAIRLTYQTYVYELNETVEIDPTNGRISPTKVSYIEDIILRALNTQMVANGNCSAVGVSVDPTQNILSTDKVEIIIKVLPVGYMKQIVVKLGFTNPSL